MNSGVEYGKSHLIPTIRCELMFFKGEMKSSKERFLSHSDKKTWRKDELFYVFNTWDRACVCVCVGGGGGGEFVLSSGWFGFPIDDFNAFFILILRLPASRCNCLFPAISKHGTNCVRIWKTDKLAFNMHFVRTS